jgi:mycofactocin precursor
VSETLLVEPVVAEAPVVEDTAERVELVEEDLLVEDVSIDGMCGVY